ncbi:MAG: CPBP family intramembrane metalloprotease domain-containing protein [Verrucomicrobia bacterium]|nr:MAG: CPBP family intramembrane metalloprotease domain-containing protein [Verrucomicrobiota bacterium]
MNIKYYKHPILFYFLATFIPWVFWFIAAYLSHQDSTNSYFKYIGGVLELLGLLSPAVVAFTMMGIDPHLQKDIFTRIFNFSRINSFYLFLTFFLMPISILLAQAISLLFGYSVDQFHFAHTSSFTFSLFPAWIMLFLAPVLEELAWHSYGTDCLRARFSLFTTCIIFGIIWTIWHVPLSFIKDYYHSNVAATGWIHSLNFIFSLFPFVILMNWLYYKTNRNILVAIIFHTTANFFNEIFQTDPDSKIIQTLLLLILSVFVIYKNPDFFFKRDLKEIQ